MKTLIAIAGYPNAGKDTIIRYLKDKHGYRREAWADKVCEVVALMYNLPYGKLLGLTDEDRIWRETPHPNVSYWQDGKFIERTPRDALNHVGDGARELNPFTWVLQLQLKIRDSLHQTPIVVSGTRKLNEAYAILNMGGELWFVERAGVTSTSSVDKEVHLLRGLATRVIQNDGTLGDLYKTVESFL